MSQLNNEDIRSKHNIPEDAKIVSYFVGEGEGENYAINAFGSTESPQPLKNHIQSQSQTQIDIYIRNICTTRQFKYYQFPLQNLN